MKTRTWYYVERYAGNGEYRTMRVSVQYQTAIREKKLLEMADPWGSYRIVQIRERKQKEGE